MGDKSPHKQRVKLNHIQLFEFNDNVHSFSISADEKNSGFSFWFWCPLKNLNIGIIYDLSAKFSAFATGKFTKNITKMLI